MKKPKIIIAGIIITVFGIGAAYLTHVNKTIGKYSGLIYPEVMVEDENLGGKSLQEAEDIIKKKYGDAIVTKKISIAAPDRTYSIDYSKLNAKYNIEEVVQQAFNYGRNLGTFQKYNLIKKPAAKKFKLKFSYDTKYVDQVLKTMAKDINRDAVNATIKMVSPGNFQITSDKSGLKLDEGILKKEILSSINGSLSGNASISAKIDNVQAKVTSKALSSIKTKVSSFSTNYSTSSYERSCNIALATATINDTILMPGDSFSFNGVVGERTTAKGYKIAGVIIGNKVDSGIGGGICQVSSTLYNAVLRADLKVTERTHHTFPSSYVPMGMDATVDYGNLDFKFKNSLDYPIYIQAYTESKNIYFNIYSDPSLTDKTYKITNDVYATIPSKIQYIDDPTLTSGETQEIQPSHTGYKVKVYRDTYENGTAVKHEVISDDTYKAVDAQIKRGTKK